MRSLTFITFAAALSIGGAAFAQDTQTQTAPAATTAAPATQADFVAGAPVRDSAGVNVGKIVSADAQKVVIDTGQTKIGVPPNFFTKDAQGVKLTITAEQFNQAVAKAHARGAAERAQTPGQTEQPPATQPPATQTQPPPSKPQ